MQRAILLVTFFAVTVMAQENTPGPRNAEAAFSLREKASGTTDRDATFGPSSSNGPLNSYGQQPTTPPPPPSKTKPASPETNKPTIEGSMVGYIDDAIVASQIRMRFDAGFHDNAPDRAEFFYPQCACFVAPGPDFPGASNNINFQQLYFQAEYAPVNRFSIFTEVPIRWIQPQPGSFIKNTFETPQTPSLQTISGVSDVRAGLKVALATSSNHAITFQFKAYLPSGDGSRGLGTDHYSIEPSLLYYQKLSDRWAVESQVGGWVPIDGSTFTFRKTSTAFGHSYAGDIFFYGFGPSYQLYRSGRVSFAPVVELFGWNVRGGLATIASSTFPFFAQQDATGTNIVNIKFGTRTSIGRHSSFYVGYGRALTSSVWYSDIVRVEYRYAFWGE